MHRPVELREPLLRVEGLVKRFIDGHKTITAVDGVNFHINAGEVYAFLGPNGAGKTTTIKMIAGLVTPDQGVVSVAGLSPHGTYDALAKLGAVLEGNRNLYWRLSPKENLEYFAAIRGVKRKDARRRAIQLLKRFDLVHKQDTHVQALSRGMQQKVAIAVCLMHQPSVLLLDEPTLGLDVESAQVITTIIRDFANNGHAVLLTTHQLDVAEQISHRVAIIKQGKLIREGDTAALICGLSTDIYQIHLAAPLSNDRALPAGVETDGDKLLVHGDIAHVYRVLDVIRPHPFISIYKADANLTDVFLKIIKEVSDDKSA